MNSTTPDGTATTINDVFTLLGNMDLTPNWDGDVIRSHCPVHGGESGTSLTVTQGAGKLLWHCFGGCDQDAVRAAIFTNGTVGNPQSSIDVNTARPKPKPVKTHDTREAAIRAAYQGEPSHEYDYHDDAGNIVATVLRYDSQDGSKTFRQISRRGDGWAAKAPETPRPLYRLPEVLTAETVYVCEGEKACDELRSLGVVATTSSGGAGNVRHSDWSVLDGKHVVIVPDNDDAGENHLAGVQGELSDSDNGGRLSVARLKDDWADIPQKGDAADWLQHFDTDSTDDLRRRLDAITKDLTSGDDTPPEPTDPTFAGLDISELQEHADSKVDWIVDRIFSSDQPTLFGARSKCLKTTQLVDLAVSLASGSQWLGAFDIPKKRRVLFITGEANNRAISRRLYKAAAARSLMFCDLAGMIRVEAVHFPKLPDLKHCIAIHDTIEKHGIEVVIVDPLYRGIPNNFDTNKMAQIGDAITTFTQWCQPASVIISHHVTKAAARELGSPPELEDMTGAGVAESCGNWWLVGRNEKYAWDWKHDLCVSFGGRDEQAGGRRILFDESTWTAEVSNLHEFIGEQQEAARAASEDRKREIHDRKVEGARHQVMRVMMNVKTPRSKSSIEDLRGGIAVHPFRSALAEMVVDETVGQFSYTDGRNRLQAGGYMLAEYGTEYEQNRTDK
jgi:hypothetical protein